VLVPNYHILLQFNT